MYEQLMVRVGWDSQRVESHCSGARWRELPTRPSEVIWPRGYRVDKPRGAGTHPTRVVGSPSPEGREGPDGQDNEMDLVMSTVSSRHPFLEVMNSLFSKSHGHRFDEI